MEHQCNTNGECWERVKQRPKTYLVSCRGNVARILKGKSAGHGYRGVDLYFGESIDRCTVHALVAKAFIGPRPEGFDIDHINGDKTNNAVENLRYLPAGENRSQGVLYREKHGSAKLTQEDVDEIRQRASTGESHYSIASDFPVGRRHVTKLVNETRWQGE